jgi:hypothetical protein
MSGARRKGEVAEHGLLRPVSARDPTVVHAPKDNSPRGVRSVALAGLEAGNPSETTTAGRRDAAPRVRCICERNEVCTTAIC